MARVTAYEATDGSLHRDRKAYLQHEANLVVAKKLKAIIAGLVTDGDEAARNAAIAEKHDFIINSIGLNTLRELLAITFKPGAEDGDGETGSAGPAASEGGAPAADGSAPADGGAPAADGAAPAAADASGTDI